MDGSQIAKKPCLKGFGNLVVDKSCYKGFMTRVEPFGKVAERFASQQETRFSVRFPEAFITSLFQAFNKVVKSPPSADKIEPPFPLPSRTPTEGSNPLFLSSFLSRHLSVIWNVN
ncbi:hypothetical protein AVEN_106348-1 [Araneus ventricosus]|uniref:Uncharacterized protein n=1 Tax=Araneus ventricosus TaxID=182803 RepID=A0A4Y2AS72_ARAVE|nr:hypothetical protein AVEN_106348-1 [Araneus ventricosus]